MLEMLLIAAMPVYHSAWSNGPAVVNRRVPVGADVQTNSRGVYNPVEPLATVLYTDSSVNQYGFLGDDHHVLYKNGDTLALVFRRYTTDPDTANTSGIIGVVWSFDNGATWHDANFINGTAPSGGYLGRYPHFAGFTSDGKPVVSWPELLAGGTGWGYMCIGVVDPNNPYSPNAHQITCSDDYQTFRSIAWKVGVDTFAVVGVGQSSGSNYNVYFWLYDAANNAMIGSVNIIRDDAAGTGISSFGPPKVQGDSMLFFAWDPSGNFGYFVIRKDGTTDPAVGSGVLKATINLEGFTIFGNPNYGSIGYALDADFVGSDLWVVYSLYDTSSTSGVDPGDPAAAGDVVVMYKVDPATGNRVGDAYIFANLDANLFPDDTVNKFWSPTYVNLIHDGSRVGFIGAWFVDNDNPGCYSSTGSAKDVLYVYTEDGGNTWTDKNATYDGATNIEAFVHPAWNGSHFLLGDELFFAYMVPTDNETDPFCNVFADGGVTGVYDYVAKETLGGGNDAYLSLIVADAGNVGQVETPVKFDVRVINNQISVQAPNAPIAIYNVKGVKVAEGRFTLRATLRTGTYFVKVADQVKKVVVK